VTGPVGYFAGHPTAANLLMALILVLGVLAVPGIVRSTFPPLPLKYVEVVMPYPGASPAIVEESLCRRIEEAVDRVPGIVEIACAAEHGAATARIEAREGSNVDRVLTNVKTEIDAIRDLPAAVEPAVVRIPGISESVVTVAVHGNLPYSELKLHAERLKRDLKAIPGVSQVRIDGFTEHQLRIELDLNAIRGLGLSPVEVANAVRRQSLDVPAGNLDSRTGTLLVRVDEERRTLDDLRSLVVASGPTGGEVRLGQIARLSDTFQYPEQRVTFDGRPAALLAVEKNRADDALDIRAAVTDYLGRTRAAAPHGLELTLTQDIASLVDDRLGMLVKNALQGLALVGLLLWLFFSARHAFWVVLGIPVSFAGCFVVMSMIGYAFDMMTLVALLVAIGILVDDAIVVSENIAAHRERGKPALAAAVEGAREVMPGVFASFATTLAMFGPLAFLAGDLGAVLRVVPVVLIITLVVSFVEAFLILPAHLAHSRLELRRGRLRHAVQRQLEDLRGRRVARWMNAFLDHRYLALGSLVATFLMTLSLLAGGVIGFSPLPELDNESMEARILLPQGTPIARTEALVAELLDALRGIDAELTPRQPKGQALVRHVAVRYGSNADAAETGSHAATIVVDLLDPSVRTISSADLRNLWRQRVGAPADVVSLKFADPQIGPAGKPIDLRVTGPDLEALRLAAEDLRAWLAGYRGVYDLSVDLRPGKRELRVRLRDGAASLGVDAEALAGQLRGAFFGITAAEIQVGPERYEIDVRFAETARHSLAAIDDFMVRTRSGQLVPLSVVATVEEARGYGRIQRVNGQRAVSVRALVDLDVVTTAAVLTDAQTRFLPGWHARHPDVALSFEGEARQSAATLGSMRRGFLLGFVAIFLLLSFQFRSYLEPVVVMVVIPLSLIGVVLGHLLMGYDLTMPSMLGLVSLTGIVVNNSILLVTFIERHLASGLPLREAVVTAGCDRVRAMLLTSGTTIAGLLPLVLETSMQAKVVIPLAISICFGLASASALVLFVVPAFYLVLDDFGLFRRLAALQGAPRADAVPPGASAGPRPLGV
jgi:hydrophobic/amphiphilic exporter-1 (mainly G- bacteria), HAE1 family